MTFHATAEQPVTVYYCKAGIQTGRTIRVMCGALIVEASGVQFAGVTATMAHDNSKGKPKASGARCVLVMTAGVVECADWRWAKGGDK